MAVVRLVVVGQALPARLRVRLQVVIRPVGYPLYLAPSPWVKVLDVVSGFGVVGKLVLRVPPDAEARGIHAQIFVPRHAVGYPSFVGLFILARLDEVLYLHHLELAGSEDEVAGGDFVSERLADLGDSERQPLSGCGEDVVEVDENPLRGFGAQIGFGGAVFDGSDGRLEHEVELPRLAHRAAAVGAAAAVEMVFPEAASARAALDQRVVKAGDMTARAPDLRAHDDGGVQPHNIIAPPDERAPPRILDVLLHLDAERAVIPRARHAAVNLAALKDEPAPLAKRNDAFEFNMRRCLFHRNLAGMKRFVYKRIERGVVGNQV